MCCNCRNFLILCKLVSFTLAGITSHILTCFLCAVNIRFLMLLSELSFCLKYEALLKYCTNSLVKGRWTLSPTVVLIFLSQHSTTTLILGTLTQGWWNTFPSPAAGWPNSDHEKAIKDILTVPDHPSTCKQACEELWPFWLASSSLLLSDLGTLNQSYVLYLKNSPSIC